MVLKTPKPQLPKNSRRLQSAPSLIAGGVDDWRGCGLDPADSACPFAPFVLAALALGALGASARSVQSAAEFCAHPLLFAFPQ